MKSLALQARLDTNKGIKIFFFNKFQNQKHKSINESLKTSFKFDIGGETVTGGCSGHHTYSTQLDRLK